MADQHRRRAQLPDEAAPGARAPRGRGRWWARRAGRRRTGRAAAPRGSRAPPGRRTARSSPRRRRAPGRGRRATSGAAVLQVGPAQVEPALQRRRRSGRPSPVPVRRARRSPRRARPARRRRRSGGRGTPATVSPGRGGRLLRQVPDGGASAARARRCRRPGSSARRARRSSVDLPAPLAPTSPTTSPGATVRSTPEKIVRAPWAAETPRATRVALTGRPYPRRAPPPADRP